MASIHGSNRRSSSQKAPQTPPASEKPTLASNPYNPNSAAYLAYPVKHVMSSLYRRMTEPPDQPVGKLLDAPSTAFSSSGAYTPPHRTSSPFQPPPLTPLQLYHPHHPETPLLLSRSLAEEIRLLVPPRLQLANTWRLAYSLEIDGASLATLYNQCAAIAARSPGRASYVLVVRDGSAASASGSVFGAYLTDTPKPSPHYYGTGECFLWRASILPSLRNLQVNMDGTGFAPPDEDLLELAGLPPPPSADTTHAQRTTTVRSERSSSSASRPTSKPTSLTSPSNNTLSPPPPSVSGTTTPDLIRFKAFPYSGENDFMIYCQHEYLSVGGGDGHYGLWLDDTLDNGISQPCLTFGNEGLSDEGEREGKGRFEVLGVEVWYVGA